MSFHDFHGVAATYPSPLVSGSGTVVVSMAAAGVVLASPSRFPVRVRCRVLQRAPFSIKRRAGEFSYAPKLPGPATVLPAWREVPRPSRSAPIPARVAQSQPAISSPAEAKPSQPIFPVLVGALRCLEAGVCQSHVPVYAEVSTLEPSASLSNNPQSEPE